tara:strand:- start:13323 stop:14189 length:867 start_codon:yes stop_codon:yes gene_type:complete
MTNIKLFLDLIRIKQPIGFMLLFWPCLWGLTISHDFDVKIFIYVKYVALFFLGSVLMRSAGCIVNDILDRKYDILVDRTKFRPIASGKISVSLSIVYTILLCALSFLILIQFNLKTIILGLASMPFAFSYPLMKRFTYWPQLFLGFTFNYGLIMAYVAVRNEISLTPILFYLGAIFWTLAYDTIYGYQDIKDDEIIGVKSTSIKFKKNPKVFIFICYLIFILMQLFVGFLMKFSLIYFIGLAIISFHLLYYQNQNLKITEPQNCLKKFRSNNLLGFIIFLNLLVSRIF